MRKVKRRLQLANVVFYAASAIYILVANLLTEFSSLLLSLYWTISVWLIFLMSIFSTRRINRYTKMLEDRIGIVSNESIMLLYNGFFFTAMVFATVVFVMNVLSFQEELPCPVKSDSRTAMENRALIASFSFQIAQSISF